MSADDSTSWKNTKDKRQSFLDLNMGAPMKYNIVRRMYILHSPYGQSMIAECLDNGQRG